MIFGSFVHFDDNDDDNNKVQRYLQVYDNHNSIMINHPNWSRF